jgi:DNA sulfur modification protein DndE
MSLDQFRVSQQAREQLIRLKRYTGVEHWNVLCRWAFCRSIAEPSIPPPAKIPADSNIELTWKVFGGRHQAVYMALLKERCAADGLEISDEVLSQQFRLHLHRGIAYLANDRKLRDGVAPMIALATA